jgi:hypothetical protein
MSLVIVIEGDTDRPVVEKLAAEAGLEVGEVLDMGGKSQLDLNVSAFNKAARGSPWLVLRDLDADQPCAPNLLRALLARPSPWMCFRIAVREVESWLLADTEAISEFLKVPIQRVPLEPDAQADPSRTPVQLAAGRRARKYGGHLCPDPGAPRPSGPCTRRS